MARSSDWWNYSLCIIMNEYSNSWLSMSKHISWLVLAMTNQLMSPMMPHGWQRVWGLLLPPNHGLRNGGCLGLVRRLQCRPILAVQSENGDVESYVKIWWVLNVKHWCFPAILAYSKICCQHFCQGWRGKHWRLPGIQNDRGDFYGLWNAEFEIIISCEAWESLCSSEIAQTVSLHWLLLLMICNSPSHSLLTITCDLRTSH